MLGLELRWYSYQCTCAQHTYCLSAVSLYVHVSKVISVYKSDDFPFTYTDISSWTLWRFLSCSFISSTEFWCLLSWTSMSLHIALCLPPQLLEVVALHIGSLCTAQSDSFSALFPSPQILAYSLQTSRKVHEKELAGRCPLVEARSLGILICHASHSLFCEWLASFV